MSLESCYFPGCKEKAVSTCSCENLTFICQSHIFNHLILQGTHLISSLIVSVSDDNQDQDKEKVRDFLLIKKSFLIKEIKELMLFSQNIINLVTTETKKIYTKLIKQKIEIDTMLESLYKNNLIHKDILKITKKYSGIYFKGHKFSIEPVSKVFNYIYDLRIKMSYKRDDKFALVFGNSSSNQLDLLNLDNYKKHTIYFETKGLAYFCGSCKIGDNKYFVCGGLGGSILSAAKIIDIKKKKIEILSSESALYTNGLAFFNDEVYCFGGYNGSSALSICKKFNLKQKAWISIDSLPEANCHVTASIDDSQILVSGFNSGSIFIYNPIEDYFRCSDYLLANNKYKFIFKNWVVCFGEFLYFIDRNQKLLKKQILIDSGASLNSSCPFIRNKYIYFVLHGPKLYRICTESHSIEQISIVS